MGQSRHNQPSKKLLLSWTIGPVLDNLKIRGNIPFLLSFRKKNSRFIGKKSLREGSTRFKLIIDKMI